MKLTKRDKQLLIVLLIFGIVALYYQFVYLEQSSKLKELYDEKTSKELKLIEMRGKVAKLPAIDGELEEKSFILSNLNSSTGFLYSTTDFFATLLEELPCKL